MSTLPPQDPSSPGAVAGATFPTVRKGGFDPAVVRDYLRQVSQELSRAQHERDRLARELEEARDAARRAEPQHMDEATVAAKLGEEAARVLSTAHEAAGQIRTKAENTAEQVLRDAELDASRQRGEAEVEATRRLREAEEQADAEIEGAKAEGREMVAEARAVRERIFADLTRRRELARRQIEALQAGRTRIMAAFLGARGDVEGIIAELEALAPPEADDEDEAPELVESGPARAAGPTGLVLGEGPRGAGVSPSIVGQLIEAVEEEPLSRPATARLTVVADEDDVDEADSDSDSDDDEADSDDEFDDVEVYDDVEDGDRDGVEVYDAEDEDVADELDEENDVEPFVSASVATETDERGPETDDEAASDDAGPDETGEDDAPAEPVQDAITDEMPVVSADAPTHAVDDIFARLRASSSETVARDVLDAGPERGPDRGPDGPVVDRVADAGAAGDDDGPDARAEALSRRAVVLGPVRATLSRQLKRVLADEQNEVLDRLRQRHASLAPDDVLGSPEHQAGTYQEAAEDQLWAAAEHGAHALSALEGEELHAALEARSVLERCLDTLTTELVVPLRTRLIENLAGCVDGTEAAAAVRATYREWKGRIDELSDDLARTAYGRASYAVLAPGTPVCWVVDPSGPGCADAEDNVLAGPVPAGEPFPTGHRYAPAYRGCRCLLVPDRL